MSQAIPADVRERVIQAAQDLYEQSGRQTMPTVDAVRRQARVDMNAASAVMRDWRRAQTAQAAPVAVTVPEVVTQANSAALAALWQQAQELANESLRAAQAAWETERADAEHDREELAEAYERQAAELEQIKAAAALAEKAHQEQHAGTAAELATARAELAQAVTKAERAEAKAGEIEHRAADLRAELDRAHQDSDHARTELNTLAGELRLSQDNAAALRAELKAAETVNAQEVERLHESARLDRERILAELAAAKDAASKAQESAAEARERAAGLSGQLEAVQQQSAALLARLAAPVKPGAKPAKPARAKKETGQ